jgi:glycosyltransferase involved in cell wall biosynthesis
MSAGIKVIAAIPCYNTEPSIADVVSAARKHTDQVLVIDDGSRDGTAEVARAAGAVVICHGINKGYGEAVKTCFQAAKTNGADILVTIDGDGQHNPEEIPLLFAPIVEGKADIVIGSRFLASEVNMPRYRRFGIGVITFLFNFGSRIKVSDAQSGFRAYSKKMIDTLLLSDTGMSISIESLEKARLNGAIIKEVPISCFYIPSTLNFNAIKHGLGVALSVIRIRLKHGLLGRNNRHGKA